MLIEFFGSNCIWLETRRVCLANTQAKNGHETKTEEDQNAMAIGLVDTSTKGQRSSSFPHSQAAGRKNRLNKIY